MVDFGVTFEVSPDVVASFVAMGCVPVSGCPGGLTYIQSAVSFAICNIDDSFEFVQVPITLDVVLVVNTFDCFVELFDSFDLEIAVVAFDSFEDFPPSQCLRLGSWLPSCAACICVHFVERWV